MHSTYELVIDDNAGMTTIVPVYQAEVSIGRKTGNFIRLADRNISRRHARLVRFGDHLGIEDLGSYTGVRVNGQRIAGRTTIDAGDAVQIGDYNLALRRVAVAAVGPVRTAVERALPPDSSTESRLPEAAPPPRRRGVSGRILWGMTVGVLLTTVLCGSLHYRQVTLAKGNENTTPPVRPLQAPVRPAVPKAAAPARTSGEPITNHDPVFLLTAPSVVTAPARRGPLHHHGTHTTTVSRTTDAATLTPEQAAELLAAAQDHYVNGEFTASIRIARMLKTSQDVAMTRAWRIQGAAACKLGDFALINEAYRHLDAVARQYMSYVCQQSGATLSSGHFIPAGPPGR